MMDLTTEDIEVLLDSLKYSIQRVSDAPGSPHGVRTENLARLEAVRQKLRGIPDGQQQLGRVVGDIP